MACRICRRPNHNARSCKKGKKGRKLRRSKRRNPGFRRRNTALLDSTREMDLSYNYTGRRRNPSLRRNSALLDSTREMELSYNYTGGRHNPLFADPNDEIGEFRTGAWGQEDVWDTPTVVLPRQKAYSEVKNILFAADWSTIASLLSEPRMREMKYRALRKVLQNDPQVDLAFQNFIKVLDDTSEEAIIFG